MVCNSCASRKKLVVDNDSMAVDDSARTLARICDLCFYGVSPCNHQEIFESSLPSFSSLGGPLSPNRIKVGSTIRYRSRKRLLHDDMDQKVHLTMISLDE